MRAEAKVLLERVSGAVSVAPITICIRMLRAMIVVGCADGGMVNKENV
jgi:hypothetical protein